VKSADTVRRVFELRRAGWTQLAIAAEVDLHQSTVGRWLRTNEDVLVRGRTIRGRRACPDGCAVRAAVPGAAYSYVLGQYLGDGWINRNLPRGVERLVLACCAQYPAIVEECRRAIAAVMPGRSIAIGARQGVLSVSCYSTHWSCVFPQSGPGAKHTRRIVLADWQEQFALVEQPAMFVRGLIHSDGWRGINPVRGASGKRYAYVRYQFSNRSEDIRQLFVRACAALDVECRQMNAYNISVNKRASVAILDRCVGPKC
jgi:hypothetical protein